MKRRSKIDLLVFFAKYQLISKGLLLIVFFIANGIINHLVTTRGLDHLSSGNFLYFIFSLQGLWVLGLIFVLLAVLIALDINAFVLASGIHYRGGEFSIKEILVLSLKSIKLFLTPWALVPMAYVALIVPLVGIGLTIRPLAHFQIPNFILEVIMANPTYRSAYIGLILGLGIFALFNIFFFQYLLLDKEDIKTSIVKSALLVRKNYKAILVDFFLWVILISVILFLIIFITLVFFDFILESHKLSLMTSRVIAIVGAMYVGEFLLLFSLMSLPLITVRLSKLFFKYKGPSDLSYESTSESTRSPKAKGFSYLLVFFIGLGLFNLATASLSASYFDELFRGPKDIKLIAHRAGGNLAAENSLKGMDLAYLAGASWSEIDIQRTKDGYYIINHDQTFERLSGDRRKPSQLRLEDIEKLEIKDNFDPARPSQKIPRLEDFLQEAKGKMGLLLELKGETANRQMVDDVVGLVKDYNMVDQVLIVSLNYDLIAYTEEAYPEMETGFIYFYAHGDLGSIKADTLIMEERLAKGPSIASAKAQGKNVIVWTVNEQESINRLARSDVDGIITDQVPRLVQAMERRDKRTDLELILDNFLLGILGYN